ncbi:restriction endonuclease subunit S [Nonomuraea muscovyensis]
MSDPDIGDVAATGESLESLPDGWAKATIGDLLIWIEAGKSFKCAPRPAMPDEWGVIKVSAMTWGEFRPEENKAVLDDVMLSPEHEIYPGDVLLSRANTVDYVGAPVLVDSTRARLLLSDKSLRLILGSGVHRKWITYWLQAPAVRRSIAAKATGTSDSMRNISQSDLKNIVIPIPPVDEQRRIAETLDAQMVCLREIEKRLRTAQDRLAQLKDSLMIAASTGVLNPGMEGRSASIPPSPAVQDGVLPLLAEGWRWARLEEIADVIGGVTKDSKRQDDPGYKEVPYLRVANAQRGYLDLTNVARIRVLPETLKKLRLQKGDILMTEGGDRDKLGRGWIWEEQVRDCIHQNHLFRARVHAAATHPTLLAWFINSAARGWFETNAKQSVNLASISISKVKQLPVPLPPPGAADEAVDCGTQALDRVNVLEIAVRDGLARVANLRRTLLIQAYEGQLVPQDPADEPAEHLLKRVRVEREATVAERKAARRASRAKNTMSSKDLATSRKAPPPSIPPSTAEQITLPLEFTA